VFYRDPRHIYRSTQLDAFPWLIHGFGTRISADGRTGVLGQGDALLEDTPGAVIAVKTADCVPILLVDERNRAIAAVHAGWRGTVARIALQAVQAMSRRFSTDPRDVHAAIGPAIGVCCYEVGPEVAVQFGLEGRAHLDLTAANRVQLLESGVTAERIDASNLCTMCRPEDFHSFRRDGEAAGRLYSFAGIVAR
jgi:YfiH family protein